MKHLYRPPTVRQIVLGACEGDNNRGMAFRPTQQHGGTTKWLADDGFLERAQIGGGYFLSAAGKRELARLRAAHGHQPGKVAT